MTWASQPTSCRDSADAGWASQPQSAREPLLYVEGGYVEDGYVETQTLGNWASQPTSCRDFVGGGQLYGGGGLVEVDALLGSGTVTTAHGWTTPIIRSCRDGE